MQTQNWDHKIKYFSKIFGFQDNQIEQTFESEHRADTYRKSNRGIQILSNSFLSQSSVHSHDQSYQLEKKWSVFLRVPIKYSNTREILNLLNQCTYIPKQILPWLSSNPQKMNAKIFNIKKQQYRQNKYLTQTLPKIQVNQDNAKNQFFMEIIGAFLNTRQDMVLSQTLINIATTIFNYSPETPVITYSLINHICTSEVYIGLISNYPVLYEKQIDYICHNIHKNCSSATFLRKQQISLKHFIKMWVQSFWLCLHDNDSLFREKIIYYLLINQMRFQSISKLCEAIIISLSRLLNQGVKQKMVYTLNNPKFFIDKEIFLKYLFSE